MLQIILGYLLADFLAGLYHWVKDSYFTPNTPWIGKLYIWNSRLHHIKPRHILRNSDWKIAGESGLWTLLWMWPFFLWCGPTSFLCSLFFWLAISDVVHKYSHMSEHECPYIPYILQEICIFQSQEQHHQHHINPHEVNYCPVTPFVNWPLELIGFWRKLEWIVLHTTGVRARATADVWTETEGVVKFY